MKIPMKITENNVLALLTLPAVLALNFAMIRPCAADSAVSKAAKVPEISIRQPANGASINAMWMDLSGTFAAKNLKQITVANPAGGVTMPTLISGNTFEARNIFLGPGTNTIIAVVEDMAGNLGSNSIIIVGPTNADGIPIFPVQVQLVPSGGFAPLPVVFNVQTHVPGNIQKVFYDFEGKNVSDQINTDLRPVTHTYKTYGEYFPVVTVQTSVGRFSSLSGMLVGFLGDMGSLFVNVQMPPVLLSTIKITDPVDVKWTAASNLYVLSGSTGTITEFDANGKAIRSKTGIGSTPSGIAVDAAGSVYVAMTGNNQVWKFKPTADTFEPDTSFGNGGFIGSKDGSAGSDADHFNAPFDVAISGNGQMIKVSDSGNQRIEQFALTGTLAASSSVEGGLQKQLLAPKGLALNDIGFFTFVVDSGNNRIVLGSDIGFMGSSGTNGAELGQFNGAFHLSANNRGLYVADTGNNRVQVFSPVEAREGHATTPFSPRLALSGELGLNHPKSVAAVDDFLEEKLYIADTGNNRVLLVKLPSDNPEAVWKAMNARLKAGDVEGAVSYFSFTAKDKYREAFSALSKDELRSAAKDAVSIKPASIEGDQAQYYFDSIVDGQKITFPIEFDKEMGQWKILEY
jgi:hypothetical protein